MKRGRAHLSVVVEEPRQRDLSLFPKFVASEMLQHSKCPEKMPKQFDVVWNRLMDARANGPLAPVDQWGCERLFQVCGLLLLRNSYHKTRLFRPMLLLLRSVIRKCSRCFCLLNQRTKRRKKAWTI